MKILYVGEFCTPQYDDAMADALSGLGCSVIKFKTYNYLRPGNINLKIQYKLMFGPNFIKLWIDLYNISKLTMPDIIYFRRPIEFPPWLLGLIKRRTNAILIEYMNDDPFGLNTNKQWFRYFKKSIHLFDMHFVFRSVNINEFYKAGAKNVELLFPYYVKNIHKPSPLSPAELSEFSCDAIFIGHGENDVRCDCFDAIIEEGLSLKLAGSNFEKYAASRAHHVLMPTAYYGPEQYAKAIKAANASLCFFSNENRDVITTRVFEIPACGGVLVSQRNYLITSIFNDGSEALFFDNPAELVSIIKLLKRDNNLRNSILENGMQKVLKNNHEVRDRARLIISAAETLLNK